MRVPVVCALCLSIAGLAPAPVRSAGPPSAATKERAREAIVQALEKAGDVPGQARVLTELAWPAGQRDEAVAAEARLELVKFGERSIVALRKAMNTVKIDYTQEVMATTLGAQRFAPPGTQPEHLAAAIDALWVGSRAAKRLAIEAIAVDRTPMAVGAMIDSAIDDPELGPQVVEALGRMRFQQARFYLERVMMEGPMELRPVAASSLSQIGGIAIRSLRNALKAPSREARLLAARALLPVATEYDVGAIYEYMEKHGDDDPTLTAELKAHSARIEKAIAARDANAAAASPQDF